MPLVAGFASSHAPVMFEPVERWPVIHDRVPAVARHSRPPGVEDETPEVRVELKAAIDRNLATLRAAAAEAELDVMVILGDDQDDMFDRGNMPTLALFTGDQVWGLTATGYSPFASREKVLFDCDGEFGEWLAAALVAEDFDVSLSREFTPRGKPEHGISHMVAHIVPSVLGADPVPIVPFFINEYFPPLPTGRRCVALGRALARILARTDKRVGLFASGGLSHDPAGPRAGWIDQRLDRWVLRMIENNDVDALSSLFSIESDTLVGGTGEIRAWMVVAAAMDRPGTVVDYLPIHHGKTGLGWVSWPRTH